jgi:hypothetical protein
MGIRLELLYEDLDRFDRACAKRSNCFAEAFLMHSMKLIPCISALLVVGCATLKPEDYGLRHVAIGGEDYYCAPREWVVPPVVPQEAADDPLFPLYKEFLALPDRDIIYDTHAPTREVCITAAQWPHWLTMRTRWNRDWAVTPGVAERLAPPRAAAAL